MGIMQRGKLYALLVCLVFLLLVPPFFEGSVFISKLIPLFFSLILVSGIFAVSEKNRRNCIIAITLAVPTVVLLWTDAQKSGPVLSIVTELLVVVFCFFTVFRLVSHLLNTERVTADTLAGAASAYLLIGVSYGILYTFISTMSPGAFVVSGAYPADFTNTSVMIYYSFATLTTLGYGDIVPVATYSRMLSVVEASTGVLFVAFLVSRLVGMRLQQLNKEEPGEDPEE